MVPGIYRWNLEQSRDDEHEGSPPPGGAYPGR